MCAIICSILLCCKERQSVHSSLTRIAYKKAAFLSFIAQDIFTLAARDSLIIPSKNNVLLSLFPWHSTRKRGSYFCWVFLLEFLQTVFFHSFHVVCRNISSFSENKYANLGYNERLQRMQMKTKTPSSQLHVPNTIQPILSSFNLI